MGLVTSVSALLIHPFNKIILPTLAGHQDNRLLLEQRFCQYVQLIAVLAMSLGVGCYILGPMVIRFVYGSKYELATTVVGWIAFMWSMRMLRGTPSMAAMALGDTRSIFYINLWRTSALALVVVAAMLGLSMKWIAIAGIVGELVALVGGIPRLMSRHNISVGIVLRPVVLVALGFTLTVVVAGFIPTDAHCTVLIVTFVLLMMFLYAMLLVTCRELQLQAIGLWKKLGRCRVRVENNV